MTASKLRSASALPSIPINMTGQQGGQVSSGLRLDVSLHFASLLLPSVYRVSAELRWLRGD